MTHKTNGWGRVEYRIVDASAEAKKPCYEIRYADTNELVCYATTMQEAGKYAEGTLQGIVIE
jgi:hypothetical protein